jgi:hypothetical protein
VAAMWKKHRAANGHLDDEPHLVEPWTLRQEDARSQKRYKS